MSGFVLIAQLLAQETASSAAIEAADAAATGGIDWSGWWQAAVSTNGRLALAVVLGTLGLWMMLPAPGKRSRVLGSVLAFGGALSMLSLAPLLGGAMQVPFSLLSSIALVAAVSAVTARNPVYAAIWFALLLLSVGGLFLINGAQFLGIATVAVYAGAIVVTFLFVLMLAQPEGHAFYDRVGWGKVSQFVGCLAGMVVAAAIVWAVMEPGAIPELPELVAAEERVVDHPQHVASLGGQLFTRHLVAVQAAGALLLAALVGAVGMASHGTGARGLEERMSSSATSAAIGDVHDE